MLTYLQGISHPEISIAVNQCARFSANPKLSHERNLIDTKDRGLMFNCDASKGLECFVDAYFACGWNIDDPLNAENLLSRTGFVIRCCNIPIYWRRKLQTEISFSTCEAECIELSAAVREMIPLMQLLKCLKVTWDVVTTPSEVTYGIFEDIQSCVSVGESKKPPQTYFYQVSSFT